MVVDFVSKTTTEKFKGKYKVASTRLPDWNYAESGYYFITICTKDRVHFFGKIEKGEMYVSEIGKIVRKFWMEIPRHFPFVILDEFVVMPNHIHGIVIINNDETCNVETLQCNVSTNNYNYYSEISPKERSLSTIIRSYKSICTKIINKTLDTEYFSWQPRFYDHIIRNESALEKIRQYIIDNPKNWDKDENNI